MTTLQSEELELRFDEATGAFSALDRRAQQLWASDPWQNTAGRLLIADPNGRTFDFSLSDAERVRVRLAGQNAAELEFATLKFAGEGWADVSVRARVSIAAYGFDVEIVAVTFPGAFRLVHLEYPCRFGALRTDHDRGQLVIPYWQGSIVPSITGTFASIPRVPFWAWDDMPWRDPGTINLPVHAWNGLSMPFFGLIHGASTWGAILDPEDDSGIRCYLNNNLQNELDARGRRSTFPRIAAISPLFFGTRGAWKYPHAVRYRLLPDGSHTAIAKHYRAHARRRGQLVTLREKIARNPNIAAILGGPLVNVMGGYPWYIDNPAFRFTWPQAEKVFEDMAARMGVKSALICLWAGYQHFPPNSFPFHPANGTTEELAGMVARAQQRNQLVCFYHGYPALLDHDPAAPPWSQARQVMPQGAIKSRWGRLCSSHYLEYAKKNLPRSIAVSGQVADYSDMVTAGPIDECWAEGHALTRTEDRRNKENLFAYINSLGLFTGSENPRSWAVPFLAYAKNGSMGGGLPILNAIPVPLFSLVFKDCLLLYREQQTSTTSAIFQDLAIGNHPQMHITIPEYPALRDEVKSPLEVFAAVNRDTALEELAEHAFVDEVNGPFVTRFVNGTRIAVNPTLDKREAGGHPLVPESVRIAFSGGRTLEVSPLPKGFSTRETKL